MVQAEKLDLSRVGGPVYVGRANGLQASDKFKLDSLDNQEGVVEVIVPQSTYALNSSFFLGMFDKSIKHAGSRESFLNKYKFTASKEILATIDNCIDRALLDKGSLI